MIAEAVEAESFFDVAAKSMEEMRETLRSIDETDANVTDATTTGSSKTFPLELSLKSLVQKRA